MSNSESHPNDLAFPADDCGLVTASRLLGDRWVLLILRELFYGRTRFEDIRTELRIPKSVLSARLTTLVAEGLIETRNYKEAGSRTRKSYHLTDAGAGLGLTLMALLEWGNKHLETREKRVCVVDADTGNEIRIRAIDMVTGQPARLDNTKLALRPRR